jgi:cell division protein ZapA (FtsZ GTPase activity inhibitor)
MSEADSIAKAYAGTSGNVKADMYLNYMRNNLKLSDEQIKKIVDATKTDSALRREFYEGKPTIENVGGVTGSEMRRGKEASDAMKKEFSNAYEAYKKDAEKAGEDVAKSQTYEIERYPRSVLSALINGEFGDWNDPDLSPEEAKKVKKRAINTALYLGGDVVATALRNVGATFKGGTGDKESLWTQRQKSKFEAATANANKALDAGTDTEIKGKQQAFDFKQAIEKSIDDGRIQKMFDSLGEDIKANDVLRDIAKYESVANTFQGKSLDQKARIILGMEMDGKQLSTQALVAMLATLTPEEYQQLGGRIAELAKGVGSGIGEAVKGLFPSFFGNESGSLGALAGDIARGDTRAIVDDMQAGTQNFFNRLTNIDARRAKNQAEADQKAADINAIIKTKFPNLNFVGLNNGMVVMQANSAAKQLAADLGFLTNGLFDTAASIKLTRYVYDQFK